MSNSLTGAFISVLAIAASRLADSPAQKRIATWLASRDQSLLGRGCVGFDITDLPWNLDTFPADRDFLLAATLGAHNQLGWEVLDYTPNTEVFHNCLSAFGRLVEQLAMVDLKQSPSESEEPFATCAVHGVYLHPGGCVVCHDA